MKYIWIVLGVLVIGGGAFAYTQGLVPGASGSTFEGTLVDLQQKRGSYECEFKNEELVEAQVYGTIYTKDKNIRADYDFVLAGKGTYDGHVIVDGDYMYSWPQILESDGSAGIRFPYSEYEQAIDDPSHPSYQQLQVKYQFDCTRTTVDDSRFDPPTDVTFQDVSFNRETQTP